MNIKVNDFNYSVITETNICKSITITNCLSFNDYEVIFIDVAAAIKDLSIFNIKQNEDNQTVISCTKSNINIFINSISSLFDELEILELKAFIIKKFNNWDSFSKSKPQNLKDLVYSNRLKIYNNLGKYSADRVFEAFENGETFTYIETDVDAIEYDVISINSGSNFIKVATLVKGLQGGEHLIKDICEISKFAH